jgi:hypothetical protein
MDILNQKDNSMVNMKMTAISAFRYVVRSILQVLDSIFLEYFPVYRLWKRDEPSEWPLPENREKQGLEKYEYSLYSQNGEDGILRFLFSEIGASSKILVEFGFAATENNGLRLILKEGFNGVLLDGVGPTIIAFNKSTQKTGLANVKAIQQFLDLGNLKSTLLGSGLPTDIDLLSIDVDGNDYWFWKDIDYLNPRVVVVEYNASLGPDLSLTVPYDPLFDRYKKHLSGFYHGASLTAFTKLAQEKGYALVGCDSQGVNAFFVRKDCLTLSLKAVQPIAAYRPHASRLKKGFSLEEQFRIIKDMPYLTI